MLLVCLTVVVGRSQNKNAQPPYLSDSILPSFNLLLIDSTTLFNTKHIHAGKPTVLMYFSPECEHCQAQTEAILKNMDSLKNVQFYLFTTLPFNKLKDFFYFFKLYDYKNITVGRDYEFYFSRHFESQYVPFVAVYDKQKKLIKAYDGGVKVATLIEVVRQ